MREFVHGLDAIFHLAGINRASDQELEEGNVMLAKCLANALHEDGGMPAVVFSSSTHAVEPSTAYGLGKSASAKVLEDWARGAGARFIEMIIPHVFGEFGRPDYNSAVATFCHRIANGEQPEIINDSQLELIHVQDLVDEMLSAVIDGHQGQIRVEGEPISVSSVAEKLKQFHALYLSQGIVPDLTNAFDRSLFNSLRSYIGCSVFPILPQVHSDPRGWLFEAVKVHSGGQCFVSSTNPGVTRGNHFHRRKFERFVVLSGEAVIKIRKVFSSDVVELVVGKEGPACVDMLTLHTHSITNIGDGPLLTLFWADELFDKDNPDTYFEEVLI
jgi:UDP-2-acetamido-2,6-beta-L-arabino-hexul-4-ose reductase